MAAHRYWRLFVLNNSGYAIINLCELQMATTPGGASVCTGGTPISSSNYDGTWTAAKAFDGIVTGDQGWGSSNGARETQWIGYDFGAGNAVDIVEVRIVARGNTGVAGQPKLMRFQWSDDGTTWTDQGSIPEQTSWTANQVRTFDVSTMPAPYQPGLTVRNPIPKITKSKTVTKQAYGGVGSIGGVVYEGGSAPVQGATIEVFDGESNQFLTSTQTNIIGEWEAQRLDPSKEYFAIAKHPDNIWERKISTRRKSTNTVNMRGNMRHGEISNCALTSTGEIDDAYFANVIALVPCSGLDGSTTFTDILGNTWAAGGGAVISDDETYFGENTLYLNGTNAYIRCDEIADLLAGSNTFTIEFHAKVLGGGCLFAFNTSAGGNNMLLFTHYYYQNSSYLYEFSNAKRNTWAHYAFVNVGGVHRVYIDGVLMGSASNAATPAATDTFCIGQEFDSATPSDFLPAYISNIRISNVVRYENEFTPPPVAFSTS